MVGTLTLCVFLEVKQFLQTDHVSENKIMDPIYFEAYQSLAHVRCIYAVSKD